MYLKLTQLVWVIVFLLSVIKAQQNEFTYGEAGKVDHYNITDTQEPKLIFIADPGKSIRINIGDNVNGISINIYSIIIDSKLLDRYKNRFSYRIINTKSNDRHEITLHDIYKDQTDYFYICVTHNGIYTLALDVYYPPEPPICTTLAYSESSTLICESEIGRPAIDMAINTYTAYIESNDTHITHIADIEEEAVDDIITCSTIYKFIQGNTVYPKTYSCMFDIPLINTTDISSSSTIPKYSVFTLAMVILSRTI